MWVMRLSWGLVEVERKVKGDSEGHMFHARVLLVIIIVESIVRITDINRCKL